MKGAIAILVSTMVLVMLVHDKTAYAATYTVGDASGWDFGVVNWPQGKSFKAGDKLVFKYSPGDHNVVVVDANSYKSCTTPAGARTFTSGNDQITLVKGGNYFICNFPQHCQANVKIAVNAA